MAGTEGQDPYGGDIEKALYLLKQCPSYQIDQFHHHCGLRDRILPLLQLFERVLIVERRYMTVGICGPCWELHRSNVTWKGAKGALLWSPMGFEETFNSSLDPKKRAKNSELPCLQSHIVVRDMFMSSEKDWTDSSTI